MRRADILVADLSHLLEVDTIRSSTCIPSHLENQEILDLRRIEASHPALRMHVPRISEHFAYYSPPAFLPVMLIWAMVAVR